MAGFILIILLMVGTAALTYTQLDQIRIQSDQALPASQFTIALRQYAASLAQLDSDLQRQFVVGGPEVHEALDSDIAEMQHKLELAPSNLDPQYTADLEQLKATTSLLENTLTQLLAMDSRTDAMLRNLTIREAVKLIDRAKKAEQTLSATILTNMGGLIVSQTNFISDTLAVRIAITVIALVLGVTTSLLVSRSIAKPLSEMAVAAKQIAAGKLDVRVRVRSQDEPGQLAVVFNSMTEHLQQSLQNLKESNRSLELSNQELKIATAEAKEASRLKDEFLSVMSHELRTPLNAMIGFLGIMKMTGNLDERNAHMVQRVRANAERLLSLINDVLDISRIEAGRLQLFPADLSVEQLTQQIKSNMGILAEQKGLKFTVNVERDMPAIISVDQDAIHKIITNLLSNAFKFTEQGEVRLSLEAQGSDLVIKVSDTGIGIPPHMHDIIFERFRQVDASSTRRFGGSGLGLSIVQHLCNAMNGSVSVESTPEKGSTFTVCLPAFHKVLQPMEAM
jgi:signal transduction histidine kinase